MERPEVRIPARYPAVADLSGRAVVVTGASRGLGLVIADAMAAHGADVAVCARNETDLTKAAERVRTRGRRVLAQRCDVRSVADVRAFIDAVGRHFGHLDVLVNNAGAGTRTLPDELTEEEWDLVADTNVKGGFFMAQRAVRLMRQDAGHSALPTAGVEDPGTAARGRIINIASALGAIGHPRFVAYATSKGAIIQMTRAMAVAWAPDILVNAVAPGYIDSPLNAYRKGNPSLEAEVLEPTPLHRWGQVEDVAMACVFLASDAAAFITGQTLFVDGGLSIA